MDGGGLMQMLMVERGVGVEGDRRIETLYQAWSKSTRRPA